MGSGCAWSTRRAYQIDTQPCCEDPGDGPERKPPTPKSPTVAELKGRLAELGIDIPPHAVEKSELIAAVSNGEKQRTTAMSSTGGSWNKSLNETVRSAGTDDGPRSGAASEEPHSPVSLCMTPKRSVAALKMRLKELGFKVPTSIVEKSELLAIVEEAERQAETSGVGSPKAPKTSSAVFKLKMKLKELGVEVPDGCMDEVELQSLVKKAEQLQPSTIQQTQSGDITLTCTRSIQGVARIEMTTHTLSSSHTPPEEFPNLEGTIHGRTFRWVRGECIGHGASGTVFKAMNHTSGQMMAVKEVHMDLKRKVDERFKEALENEIELMQECRHPNIVAYYGCDWIDSRIYMYLEYMAGGSIARVLDQFGAFEESLLADYARQLLNGLEYLHTRNPYIVHRDIKGANILLGVDCTVKLADFGCSKREKETRSLTIGGSIPWMAPEVIAHARYGRAGDIWSFGCLLIEMAAAEPPWGSFDNLMAAMIKIGMSTEMPPMPLTLSRPCRAFIRRCLNRDPGRRLSASELLNERFVRASGDDLEEPLLESVEELLSEDGCKADASKEDPLPRGWEKHFDPNYSEWYYWHLPTGRSVWEKPALNELEEEDLEDDAGG